MVLTIPVFTAAVAASACVHHRPITTQEQVFAQAALGQCLRIGEHIVLTDLTGLGGGCFVCSLLNGQILMHPDGAATRICWAIAAPDTTPRQALHP
jgi:hypothetical protein